MLTGPIPATAKVLDRSGLTLGDIGRSRSTRRSPACSVAWQIETGADPARVNPNGGAIALGHRLARLVRG